MYESRSLLLTRKINSLLESQSLNEASLSRIWQHLVSSRAFVMITGFRAKYTNEQNKSRNDQLIYYIHDKLGYGYFKIEGHYPEMPDHVEAQSNNSNKENLKDVFTSGVRQRIKSEKETVYGQDVIEDSFFVIDHTNNPKKFRDQMTELGAMFDQDSIFYKDQKGRCFFLYTRDVDGYHKGQRQKLPGDLLTSPKSLGRFFSTLKGKGFTFSVSDF